MGEDDIPSLVSVPFSIPINYFYYNTHVYHCMLPDMQVTTQKCNKQII